MSIHMNIDYDYLFKILVIGDTSSGKSNLLLKFTDGTFTDAHYSTIGVDFKIKSIIENDIVAKLQIWDTAGQERFRTITSSYYRGGHGVLICFDLTNLASYQNISYWLEGVYRLNPRNICIFVIGTKADLKEKRVAPSEKELKDEIQKMFKVRYIETSAKSNYNVEHTFKELAYELIENYRKAGIRTISEKKQELIGTIINPKETIVPLITESEKIKKSCC